MSREVYMSKQKQQDGKSNIKRMQDIVRNTEENLHEAEISIEFTAPLQKVEDEQKNERRKHSIEALKEEIKEEILERKKD